MNYLALIIDDDKTCSKVIEKVLSKSGVERILHAKKMVG